MDEQPDTEVTSEAAAGADDGAGGSREPAAEPAIAARGEEFALADRLLLREHVINLNQGLLSGGGLFDNTPADVDAIFDEHLPRYVEASAGPVRLVFYAHGGLVNEPGALRMALKHLRWWLKNGELPGAQRRVYPIYFVWETGFLETIAQLLSRIGQRTAAARGVRDVFDFTTDPVIEAGARLFGGVLIWGGMKFSAQAASDSQGGAFFAAQGLHRLLQRFPGRLELHAVGHSAGAIFHAYFVPMAARVTGQPFRRAYFMAPAIRVDTFKEQLRPALLPENGAAPALQELVMFTMHKDAERADHCAHVYRKSLLYLIHHALEKEGRAPILGLQDSVRGDTVLRNLFGLSGDDGPGQVIWSPTAAADGDSATRSLTHGGFDDDVATMNSILRRVCGLGSGDDIHSFPPPVSRSADPWAEARAVPEELAFLVDESAPVAVFAGSRAPGGDGGGGTGRRRALCVGINDYPRAPLAGCVADAQDWSRALEALGFEPPRLLTDGQATRARILDELDLLIQTSRPGDVVAFQFAGHGTQAPDRSGDEAGGDSPDQDEAICPYDFDLGHLLIDDDLGEVFARTPEGVCVTCFIDCCHSGTITRFAAGEPGGARAGERARFLKLTAEELGKHLQFRRGQRAARALGRRRSLDEMREVVFSACLSVEVALESDGHGHFTVQATQVLRNGGALSNDEFQRQVTQAFGTAPRQHPNLDCSPRARGLLLFNAAGPGRPAGAAAVPTTATPAPAADTTTAGDLRALAGALRAAAAALERR
jgi:hypothetical protein